MPLECRKLAKLKINLMLTTLCKYRPTVNVDHLTSRSETKGLTVILSDGFINPCVVFVFAQDLIVNALISVTKKYRTKTL